MLKSNIKCTYRNSERERERERCLIRRRDAYRDMLS